MPHRTLLLSLLSKYSPIDDQDLEILHRFSSFVRAETDCFERSLKIGHLTGSAWVADYFAERVALVHHKKLGRWLQPGGHADGESDLLSVARREAEEETGLKNLIAHSSEIFDLDIHLIPEHKDEPEHFHYDVRFAFRANPGAELLLSDESNDLLWVQLDEIDIFTKEESVLRMKRKWVSRSK